LQIAEAAPARVRAKVRPEQYQMFEMFVLQGQRGAQVAKDMGVSLITAYLAKHRVSALLRKESARLEKQML
jgi:RNA polymerase sigma-70 factor (ECF subfamily)